jgi:hypothetical protein
MEVSTGPGILAALLLDPATGAFGDGGLPPLLWRGTGVTDSTVADILVEELNDRLRGLTWEKRRSADRIEVAAR